MTALPSRVIALGSGLREKLLSVTRLQGGTALAFPGTVCYS